MADHLSAVVAAVYGKTPAVIQSADAANRVYLKFASPAALSYLNRLEEEPAAVPFIQKCSGCRTAFSRGMFLMSGRILRPQSGTDGLPDTGAGSYLLEFSCGTYTGRFRSFLMQLGMEPKHRHRRDEDLLYFQDSAAVEDFLAVMGETASSFAVMNEKILREYRNRANRIANCEASNISKAVSSAAVQTRAIRALEQAGRLEALSPELIRTARLRLEYPDATLKQLCDRALFPITRSGLAHRLAKLTELAEKIKD